MSLVTCLGTLVCFFSLYFPPEITANGFLVAVSSTSIRNSYLVGKIVASPATEFFPPHLKIQDDTGDLPIVISGVSMNSVETTVSLPNIILQVSPNCVDRVCGIKDYFVIIERIETDSPELLYIQCTVDALEELDSDTKAVQHRLGLERNTIENPRAYLFMVHYSMIVEYGTANMIFHSAQRLRYQLKMLLLVVFGGPTRVPIQFQLASNSMSLPQ
jgi:hypothetical protein